MNRLRIVSGAAMLAVVALVSTSAQTPYSPPKTPSGSRATSILTVGASRSTWTAVLTSRAMRRPLWETLCFTG